MDHATLRAIVDLLPRYAHRRRAGWVPSVPRPSIDASLPDYLLLRRVAIEREDGPILLADLRNNLIDSYSTVDATLDRLPRLVDLGLLSQSSNEYAVTPLGEDWLMRGEPAANDFAAARLRLPSADLVHLAATLHDVAERLLRAPEPTVKEHQHRVPRLRRFDQRQTPPVRLEYALYALQRARDDAHLAAWRATGWHGPALELLGRVWKREVSTITGLAEASRNRMRRDDVLTLLEGLERDGFIRVDQQQVAITQRGREVRDEIERETDRLYLDPWPDIDAFWVCDRLEALTAAFVDAP